jgi:hypothetical protein
MLFFALPAIAAPQPGGIDPTFNVGRGPLQVYPGTVYGSVLQSDGRIIIGGMFSDVGLAPVGPVVRFNADGTFDKTFDSSSVKIDEPDKVPYTSPLCLQADGKVIVGGHFSRLMEPIIRLVELITPCSD